MSDKMEYKDQATGETYRISYSEMRIFKAMLAVNLLLMALFLFTFIYVLLVLGDGDTISKINNAAEVLIKRCC